MQAWPFLFERVDAIREEHMQVDVRRQGRIEGMRIISVFNPTIVGEETHDEDGAYTPTGEFPPGQPRMFVKTVEGVRNAEHELVLAGGAAVSNRYLAAADNLGL